MSQNIWSLFQTWCILDCSVFHSSVEQTLKIFIVSNNFAISMPRNFSRQNVFQVNDRDDWLKSLLMMLCIDCCCYKRKCTNNVMNRNSCFPPLILMQSIIVINYHLAWNENWWSIVHFSAIISEMCVQLNQTKYLYIEIHFKYWINIEFALDFFVLHFNIVFCFYLINLPNGKCILVSDFPNNFLF